ncbi:hypothetical protein BaRGS_00007906, partial [Batillaria attramentaria]
MLADKPDLAAVLDRMDVYDKRGTRQLSCCTVGKMAASHDLHCLAQYHVDKLKLRDQPEVTHHKFGTQQHGRLPPHLLRDFRRCVQERPLLFQKCCYGYANESIVSTREAQGVLAADPTRRVQTDE